MNLIYLLLSSGTFLSPNNIIEKKVFKALYRKVLYDQIIGPCTLKGLLHVIYLRKSGIL